MMTDLAWPLIGHSEAEAQLLGASRDGRMHHAWLIEGPSGIGKSIMAHRVAAALLGAQLPQPERADIAVSDPVASKMLAGAHPDFRILKRMPNDKGKLPLFISVDEVRSGLVNFVTLKPALGGRRVCIVDALDDLNANGANALLKTLEEPPPDCVLLLLYHGDRPLLPTIRSRCRRLRVAPLGDDALRDVLSAQSKPSNDDAIRLSKGRPGQAIRLAEPAAQTAIQAVKSMIGQSGRINSNTASAALMKAGASDEAFDGFAAALLDWAETMAPDATNGGEVWLWVARTLEHARIDAMDRTQTAAALISGLQERLQTA